MTPTTRNNILIALSAVSALCIGAVIADLSMKSKEIGDIVPVVETVPVVVPTPVPVIDDTVKPYPGKVYISANYPAQTPSPLRQNLTETKPEPKTEVKPVGRVRSTPVATAAPVEKEPLREGDLHLTYAGQKVRWMRVKDGALVDAPSTLR